MATGGPELRGHIQPRGANTWRLHARVRTPDGHWRSITRTVHGTRQEADKALARLLVDIDERKHTAAPGTINHLADRWVAVAGPYWSPNTRRTHQSILATHILPGLGTVQVRRLRTADIDRFYRDLTRRGLAPATIRRVHGVLRRMLEQAILWDELGVNPVTHARPPALVDVEIAPPTADEVRLLLVTAENIDSAMAVFIRLAAATGGRRSELCALQWANVDLARGQVQIIRSMSAAGPAGQLKGTKTGDRRFSYKPLTER